MTQLNKLQIKAEIMTILSKLQMDVDTPYIDEYLSVLREQEDKKDILDILLKELNRANEAKSILVCLILVRLFPQEQMEDLFWNALKNPLISDDAKTVILNLLKDFGKIIDLDEIQNYFQNPQTVIDTETQRLLDNAVINPEAQIDFIDFLNSLSYDDKQTLIHSLADDYASDELANLLNPIVLYSSESEIGKECIEILGDTKSQLALYTLEEVESFTKNEEIKTLVKKNISKLKLSGIREQNAEEFYKSLLPSTPYEAYASFPDGHGNQAVIFSREKTDGQLQMVAIVINDVFGIVDCFGFNTISKLEFNSVIDKFYGYDERIYLDEHSIKRLLTIAESINRENGEEISYEYICWRNLFADITCEVLPLEVSLTANIPVREVNDMEYQKLCMMNFVQKWFFESQDSTVVKEMLDELTESVKKSDYNIDLEDVVEKNTKEIFDCNQQELLDKRLLMSSYLKYLSGYKNDAAIIFSVYHDKIRKAELMKNMLRKTIYEYFVSLKFKINEESKTTNIFSIKNKPQYPDIPVDQINKMIKKIEDLWVI